jgi:hypothetical protein
MNGECRYELVYAVLPFLAGITTSSTRGNNDKWNQRMHIIASMYCTYDIQWKRIRPGPNFARVVRG